MQIRTKICGAPGCGRLTAKAVGKETRSVNGTPVCRACYQRAWEFAKEKGLTMSRINLKDLPPPLLDPPALDATCARQGCNVAFKKGERDPNRRRFVSGKTVCRACYTLAWGKAKDRGVSLEEALAALPAKGTYKPVSKYSQVPCAMPWCSTTIRDCDGVCGPCGTYIGHLAVRYRNNPLHRKKSRDDWIAAATRGEIPPPGTPEQCSMPWCNRRVHPDQREHHGYGPEGQMICNTDRMYLYMFGRRKGISFNKAFHNAPPPLRRGLLRAQT